MRAVFEEYGGMLIAAAGSFAMFGILASVLLSDNGTLALLFRKWIGG